MGRASTQLDEARGIIMRGLKISSTDLKRALVDDGMGEEQVADMFHAEDAERDTGHGGSGSGGGGGESTSDSSAPGQDEDDSAQDTQRRTLDTMEESLLTYQRFFERLPEHFRQQDDVDAYRQLPQVLASLRSERRRCFPEDADKRVQDY